MFQFRYFHPPKMLSKVRCRKILLALSQVVNEPQEGEVHLIVISPDEIAQLNETYRGVVGPTDILTFSYLFKYKNSKKLPITYNLPPITYVAGEIYLCLEKIRLYAEERRETLEDALYSTIIHGLVHLMGYDHEDETEGEIMRGIEGEVKRRAG